jgi:hypothetical protein
VPTGNCVHCLCTIGYTTCSVSVECVTCDRAWRAIVDIGKFVMALVLSLNNRVTEALSIVRSRGFIGVRTRAGPSELAHVFVMSLDSTCLVVSLSILIISLVVLNCISEGC